MKWEERDQEKIYAPEIGGGKSVQRGRKGLGIVFVSVVEAARRCVLSSVRSNIYNDIIKG